MSWNSSLSQNFMGADQFCFRECKPGPLAPTFCQHIYDIMGCAWNMPANYDPGFESCQGDFANQKLNHFFTQIADGGVWWSDIFPRPACDATRPPASFIFTMHYIGNGFVIAGTHIGPPVAGSMGTQATARTSGGVSENTSSSIATLTSTSLPSTSAITSLPSSSSSASHSAFTDQWERTVFTIGSVIVCSMFGALFVL